MTIRGFMASVAFIHSLSILNSGKKNTQNIVGTKNNLIYPSASCSSGTQIYTGGTRRRSGLEPRFSNHRFNSESFFSNQSLSSSQWKELRLNAVSPLCSFFTLDLSGGTVVTPARGARLKKASDSGLEPSQVSFQRRPTATTLVCGGEVVHVARGAGAAAAISLVPDFSETSHLF